jgi:outer membrane protein assembly factor BamB
VLFAAIRSTRVVSTLLNRSTFSTMRTKTFFLLAVIVVLGSLLTACGNRSLASTDWPGLIVHDGKAYLAAGTYVYKVDLATGQEESVTQGDKTVAIRFPSDGKGGPFYADPAFTSDGQMIIGSANINDRTHPLFSANTKDLTTKWTYSNQAKDIWLGGALLLNDVIYVPNSDSNLYSFDLNGNLKGKFKAGDALWSTPVTDGKSIYVSSMDHNVYAVDPVNMTQIWKTPLDASITASPEIKDGRLYVGTIGGTVYGLDASTGNILWQKKFEGGIADQVALAGDRLYFGIASNQTGTIYALNTSDGSTAGTFDTGSPVTASPLVKDNMVVFVTEGGTVQALDLNLTKTLWPTIKLDAKLYSSPVDAGDLILVAPMGKAALMLVAYDVNGTQKWVFAPK